MAVDNMSYLWFIWAANTALSLAMGVEGATGDNGNVAAFNALCGIYTVAKEITDEEVPTEVLRLSDASKLTEIERFFVLTSDEEYFGEGPKPTKGDKESVDERKVRTENWKESIKAMMEEQVPGEGGKEMKKYVRPPASSARKLAHLKIKRFQEQAQNVVDSIKAADASIIRTKGQVKTLAGEVIFGAGLQAMDKSKVFKSTYADGCGNGVTGSADGPGNSIANDMVCLCTYGDGTSAQHMCGTRIGNALNSKGYTDSANPDQAFTDLVGFCNQPGGRAQDVGAIQSALSNFRSQIGADAQKQHSAEFDAILGTGRHASGCTGSTGHDYVCVNYKNQLSGTKKFEGIKWYKRMNDIVDKLREVTTNETRITDLQHRLVHLEEMAQQAYLEALHSPGPVPNQTAANADVPPAKAIFETNQETTKQGVCFFTATTMPFFAILGLVV